MSAVLAMLSRELDNAGHQVTVLAEMAGAPFDSPPDIIPLGVRPDGWRGWGAPARWCCDQRHHRLVRARATHGAWPHSATEPAMLPRPDAIVVHDDPRAVRHLHRWLPGVPVVAFQHSVPYRLPPERMPADRPDAVVAVTSALVRRIAPRLGVLPADVSVVPYGVTPGPVVRTPADPAAPACRPGLSRHFRERRGLAGESRRRGGRVGVPGGRPALVGRPRTVPPTGGARARPRLDPSAAVALAEPAPALAVLAAHDVYCLLQDVDNAYPPLILEALAAGCAVVALDTSGGGRNWLAGQRTWCRRGNPAAVRAALSAWSEDRSLLAAAQARGPSAVDGRTWAATAPRPYSTCSERPRARGRRYPRLPGFANCGRPLR